MSELELVKVLAEAGTTFASIVALIIALWVIYKGVRGKVDEDIGERKERQSRDELLKTERETYLTAIREQVNALVSITQTQVSIKDELTKLSQTQAQAIHAMTEKVSVRDQQITDVVTSIVTVGETLQEYVRTITDEALAQIVDEVRSQRAQLEQLAAELLEPIDKKIATLREETRATTTAERQVLLDQIVAFLESVTIIREISEGEQNGSH